MPTLAELEGASELTQEEKQLLLKMQFEETDSLEGKLLYAIRQAMETMLLEHGTTVTDYFWVGQVKKALKETLAGRV